MKGNTLARSCVGVQKGVLFKSFCVFFAMCFCCGFADAQIVKNVTAKQRDSLCNLVDIEYTIDGATNSMGQADTAGLSIRFQIENAETGKKCAATVFNREPPLTDGRHRVTWDPAAEGVWIQSGNVRCRAVLRKDDPKRYLVIDLACGLCAGRYPVYYLSDIPAGGWTDAYKTTKLVLKKIEPGTFRMGSPVDEAGRNSGTEKSRTVTLTKPFYVGVFEVTQGQWNLVTGGYPSRFFGALRPVEWVAYDRIRSSFLKEITDRTGLTFDLPTEAQWEYVCRAGTTSALNNGKNLSKTEGLCPELNEVGRYNANQGDKKGGYADHHTTVGSYLPNAWGLYDLHGNVQEWCLDWFQDDWGSTPATDPVGPKSGKYRVIRGGSWYAAAFTCRSASRCCGGEKQPYENVGFRPVCFVK